MQYFFTFLVIPRPQTLEKSHFFKIFQFLYSDHVQKKIHNFQKGLLRVVKTTFLDRPISWLQLIKRSQRDLMDFSVHGPKCDQIFEKIWHTPQKSCIEIFKIFQQMLSVQDSSVGRAVVSKLEGPWFKSRRIQIFCHFGHFVMYLQLLTFLYHFLAFFGLVSA